MTTLLGDLPDFNQTKVLPEPHTLQSDLWLDKVKAWPEPLRAQARARAKELVLLLTPKRKRASKASIGREAAYYAYRELRSAVEAQDVVDNQEELAIERVERNTTGFAQAIEEVGADWQKGTAA